jgi:GntR family transcriptional regulator
MPRDEEPAPAFEFRLDHSTGVPIHRQLFDQVVRAIRIGTLGFGNQLPTAASLSAALTIDPNTVLRAYRNLAADGLVESRPGKGTFVTATPGPAKKIDRDLALSLAGWIEHGIRLGLDRDDLEALFESAMRDKQFVQ